jgi:hypothetical protein
VNARVLCGDFLKRRLAAFFALCVNGVFIIFLLVQRIGFVSALLGTTCAQLYALQSASMPLRLWFHEVHFHSVQLIMMITQMAARTVEALLFVEEFDCFWLWLPPCSVLLFVFEHQ